ncbi:unnamed protein product [Closterium sp. Naga37s-1]|nr:unnamed protein product [Closterium sp. Naga37s-1]
MNQCARCLGAVAVVLSIAMVLAGFSQRVAPAPRAARMGPTAGNGGVGGAVTRGRERGEEREGGSEAGRDGEGGDEWSLGSDERFLVYASHSGFNNQVLGFTRALHMAALLNRTLVIPPKLPHMSGAGGNLDPATFRDSAWAVYSRHLLRADYVLMADVLQVAAIPPAVVRTIDLRHLVTRLCACDVAVPCWTASCHGLTRKTTSSHQVIMPASLCLAHPPQARALQHSPLCLSGWLAWAHQHEHAVNGCELLPCAQCRRARLTTCLHAASPYAPSCQARVRCLQQCGARLGAAPLPRAGLGGVVDAVWGAVHGAWGGGGEVASAWEAQGLLYRVPHMCNKTLWTIGNYSRAQLRPCANHRAQPACLHAPLLCAHVFAACMPRVRRWVRGQPMGLCMNTDLNEYLPKPTPLHRLLLPHTAKVMAFGSMFRTPIADIRLDSGPRVKRIREASLPFFLQLIVDAAVEFVREHLRRPYACVHVRGTEPPYNTKLNATLRYAGMKASSVWASMSTPLLPATLHSLTSTSTMHARMSMSPLRVLVPLPPLPPRPSIAEASLAGIVRRHGSVAGDGLPVFLMTDLDRVTWHALLLPHVAALVGGHSMKACTGGSPWQAPFGGRGSTAPPTRTHARTSHCLGWEQV